MAGASLTRLEIDELRTNCQSSTSCILSCLSEENTIDYTSKYKYCIQIAIV